MPHHQTVLAEINAVLPSLEERYSYPARPCHPGSLQLLSYWQDCMANGGFVLGKQVPNRRIGPLLRNIVVSEPYADGSNLVARLAGSVLRRRFDRDIKGALLSDLFSSEVFPRHLDSLNATIRSGTPTILDSRMMRGDIEVHRFEVLMLPVTAADLKSVWVLSGMFFFD